MDKYLTLLKTHEKTICQATRSGQKTTHQTTKRGQKQKYGMENQYSSREKKDT